jgi:O-antigen/teichoic acid export membrane protein
MIWQALRDRVQKLTVQALGSQLRLNMTSGVVTTVINSVVLAIAYPLYLHFLGYEKYGVWLVLATILGFAQLGELGIGQAVMKLVAEEHGRGNTKGIQQYVTTALLLLCFSGTFALAVILIFKTQIIAAFNLSDDNAKLVSWLLPYIGFLSIYVFVVQALNATLSGLGRMDLSNYTQSIGRVAAVIVTGILLYSGLGIESLLIGNMLSYVFIHILSLICIWRIAHIRLLRIDNLDVQRGKRIVHFGGAVLAGTVVSMLGSPFNKLMLSRYVGVASIPVYEISYSGAIMVRNLIETGFKALMPEISRISGNMTRQVKDKISQIYRRAMRLIFLVGVPIYGAMLIFAAPLLRIWLGESFIATIPLVLRIMLVATFINLLGVPSYQFLMGMGRIRDIFAARSITWLTSMALVTMVAVKTAHLSATTVSLCLCISWFLSSAYLILRFRSVMLQFEKAVSTIEE